jgi:HNH endonuclease
VSGVFIAEPLRLTNWQRAGGRCEYCLLHEDDTLIPHQPDHIVAVQHGGQTSAENLALACADCNLRKGANVASVDPTTGQRAYLFHPRQDRWLEHFRVDVRGRIHGLTPTGRATVFLLRLNTPDKVRLRQRLQRIGRYSTPP